jgi:hypothetical protein
MPQGRKPVLLAVLGDPRLNPWGTWKQKQEQQQQQKKKQIPFGHDNQKGNRNGKRRRTGEC